jgi:Flp pilus assembly protein TadG
MRRFVRLLRCQSGSAAAELALCLPFLMALIFGGMEAGNYVLTEHKVVKGVRDGARYAARLPFDNYDCENGQVVDTAENTGVVNKIKNVTRSGHPDGGPVRVSGWGSDQGDVSVTLDCDDTWNSGLYQEREAAPRVLVATRVPYPSVLGSLGFNTTGAIVRAQSQAVVMGL